jgi:hypothetical protein
VIVPAVAANVTVVAPAAMDTLAGMLTPELLLLRDTTATLAADLVNVSVHVAVAPLSRDAGAQFKAASCTCVVTVSDAVLDEPL